MLTFNYRYPQAIGAIDGSHIPVTPPLDGKSDYICRKGYPSVILQAVVDAHYQFRDVYCNTAGAAHDATVFARSPLSHNIVNNMPRHDKEINNISVPLHLLGDPAYPISNCIIKGYIGRNLTPQQESFNVYHSSARMCVEIAFGKLKSRFRILSKKMDVYTTQTPHIITACCILHNFCEKHRVPIPPRDFVEGNVNSYSQPDTQPTQRIEDREGHVIRDSIKNFLAETEPLRKSFR